MSRLILSLILLLITPANANAKPLRYMLEADKSSVGFTYQFNGTPTKGSMPVAKAELTIDFAALANSRVDISLNVKKARAGFIFATQALRGKTVLNAAKYPQIRFVSTKVVQTASGAKITGMITIRGITKPLTLSAQFYRQKGTVPKDLTKLTILLTGSVARSDFGATGYSSFVSEQIDLRILARIRQVE